MRLIGCGLTLVFSLALVSGCSGEGSPNSASNTTDPAAAQAALGQMKGMGPQSAEKDKAPAPAK